MSDWKTPEHWEITPDSRWYAISKACLEHLDMIPEHCRYGVALYVMEGCSTGDFLQAVLTNDLMHAVEKADDLNATALSNYARYLYNYTPRSCYGDESNVDKWIQMGGIKGINRRELEEARRDESAENNP